MSVEPIVKQALQQGILPNEQLSHLLHLAENEPLSTHELDLIDQLLAVLRLGRILIQRGMPQSPGLKDLKETHNSWIDYSTVFSHFKRPIQKPFPCCS